MMASKFVFHKLVLVLITHVMVSLCSTSMHPLCHDEERSFLLQFKNSLITNTSVSMNPLAYPKVELWTEKGETIDCCFWDGVQCNENTGYVISLDLSSSYLYGSVNSNSSLFNLVHLERLNLADNHFNYSQIPNAINQLSRLTHLNLSFSCFSGQVPSEISRLTKLVSLDLSGNVDDSGEIMLLKLKKPDFKSLILNLTSLEQLSLSWVDISSTVPDLLADFSSLIVLTLKNCRLQGEFPARIFQLPNLRVLSVRYNEDLSGKLPPIFQQSSPLELMRLAGTNFSGELPSSIGNLSSLNMLDFRDCKFSGVIPTSISNLNRLSYLDLSENNFRGQIPSSLSNLNHLTYLSLSSNKFSNGNLSWIGNLTKLTIVGLHESNLTGFIPESLGNLTQLTYLLLQNNQFYGPFPYFFSRLKNLKILSLYGNDLSGLVSFDMFLDMKSLVWLQISNNRLSLMEYKPRSSINASFPQFKVLGLDSCHLKKFPEFLRYQGRMKLLSLANNEIHGQIPKWIWNMSINTLVNFDLSNNSLTGFEQPPSILPWLNLGIFELSDNMLIGPLPIPPLSTHVYHVSSNYITGEISPLICKLQNLEALVLSNNKLSGRIPECLGNFSNSLTTLNLGNNNFSGEIPNTFTSTSQLVLIDLSYNNLQGSLPRSLVNCKMLQGLYLRNNKLKDVFPSWLGTLPVLQILILQSNRFHGEMGMPVNKLEFPKLRVIDLSFNNFSGKLPSKYIQSWNAMKNNSVSNVLTYLKEYISFTNASYIWQDVFVFSITIANKGGNLKYGVVPDALAVIDLSSNNFEGEIPKAIGNLKGLHVLNLSNNILVGDIPLSLGNLTELESLDLSNNKLSGHIPQELNKLNFLSHFNVSHNNLIGPIPQGKQFNTFENNSYAGNSGLCGDPLTKRCGNPEDSRPPSSISEEDHQDSGFVFEFGWKQVLIGYASGLVVGLVIGQIVISKKKRWFALNFGIKPPTRRIIRRMRRGN